MLKEAMLYRAIDDKKVHCYLCNHHCRISEGKFGFCGVRENRDGKLYTHAYGEVIAANVDPIEKKPLYHFLPGSTSYSIATMGCNFRCGFCQNWQISQLSQRDGAARAGHRQSPDKIVQEARAMRCLSISYTYTEPTIFFEYAFDTARLAKQDGLYNVFVTNGFMTREALDAIAPHLDACNVDLKSFREDFYRKTCHGHLQPVLESIRHMKALNIWVEITTLVIPNQNDDQAEFADIAAFIAELDRDIPWHISRFHPDYRFTDVPPTPMETLRKAHALGRAAGLRYIYVGNVLGESPDTVCPGCQTLLIHRAGFSVQRNRLAGPSCPECGATIAGVF